jgi:hypothetical protein
MNGQGVQVTKGTGIASFVIALVVLVCVFLSFVVAGVAKSAGAATPVFNAVIGSALFFFWLLAGVGIALGIAGCIGQNAKKTLPVLGIVINGFVVMMSVLLVLVGLHMIAS